MARRGTLRFAAVLVVLVAVAFAASFAVGRATRSHRAPAAAAPYVHRFVPAEAHPPIPNLEPAGAFPGLRVSQGPTGTGP